MRRAGRVGLSGADPGERDAHPSPDPYDPDELSSAITDGSRETNRFLARLGLGALLSGSHLPADDAAPVDAVPVPDAPPADERDATWVTVGIGALLFGIFWLGSKA